MQADIVHTRDFKNILICVQKPRLYREILMRVWVYMFGSVHFPLCRCTLFIMLLHPIQIQKHDLKNYLTTVSNNNFLRRKRMIEKCIYLLTWIDYILHIELKLIIYQLHIYQIGWRYCPTYHQLYLWNNPSPLPFPHSQENSLHSPQKVTLTKDPFPKSPYHVDPIHMD